MIASSSSKAVKALIDAGIIPARCKRFDLRIAVGETVTAVCECHVSEEEFEKIAAALIGNPDEAASISRKLLLRPYGIGTGPDEKVLEIPL